MEHPFHVESICGTRLIVGTPLKIWGKLSSPGVVDYPRIALADGVLRPHKDDGYVVWRGRGMVVVRHLGEVTVDGIEAELVLQTEDKDNSVDPLSELTWKSLFLTGI